MKRSHFYVKVSKGRPVIGSLIERQKAPRDGGNWVMIDSCLGLCCAMDTLPSPANFAVTSGATGVNVSNWSAVPGATNYVLEQSTSADFSTALTTIYSGALLTYSKTGLTSGSTYYYRLSASGANYEGSAYAYASHVAP